MARDDVRAKLAAGILIALAVGSAVQGALGARQGVSFARRSERKTWGGPVGEGENEGGVAFHPKSYPLFKQCDDWWGDDTMETKTICEAGDLMTSLAMGLAGWKISLDGSPSNPGNLNNWLLENDGYTDSNNLIEDALNALVPGMWSQSGMHTTNDISVDDLKDLMNHDYIVVANVMKGRHFVLATGYDGWDTVYVNDPGFDNTQYSYSQDVWGWRIFSMNN